MESLSSLLLGKDLYSLVSSDLEEFFSTAQQETTFIEFKSGDVALESVYKEVAAFANTSGGILIIGAPKEEIDIDKRSKGNWKGALTYCKNFKSKDWLSRKIASSVSPMPAGIRIQELANEHGKQFIIEIAQSSFPPHQVLETGVYYVRVEEEARPAPHAFVAALFGKRRLPELQAKVYFESIERFQSSVTITVTNITDVPSDRVCFYVAVWNVRNVEHKRFAKESGGHVRKFSFSSSSDQVLVKGLEIPINLVLDNWPQPFMVTISYWSIDCALKRSYWIVDPETQAVKEQGLIETYDDAVNRFIESCLQLPDPDQAFPEEKPTWY